MTSVNFIHLPLTDSKLITRTCHALFSEKPVPRRKVTLTAEPTRSRMLWLSKTALVHALIVKPPWPNWSGWVSQMFIWRKVGQARRVTLQSQHLMMSVYCSLSFIRFVVVLDIHKRSSYDSLFQAFRSWGQRKEIWAEIPRAALHYPNAWNRLVVVEWFGLFVCNACIYVKTRTLCNFSVSDLK